jgi:adenine deaminase
MLTFILLPIFQLFCALALVGGTAHAGETFMLKNATLIDPRTETLRQASMLIRGNAVEQVIDSASSASLPQASETLDLQGKWLLPTLVDLHFKAFQSIVKYST